MARGHPPCEGEKRGCYATIPPTQVFTTGPLLRRSSAALFRDESHAWAGLCQNPAYGAHDGPEPKLQTTPAPASFRMLVDCA